MFDLWALCVGGAALPWSGPSPRISYDLWALCISGVAMQRVGEAFYQNFFYLWALCVGGLALLRVGEAFYQNFFICERCVLADWLCWGHGQPSTRRCFDLLALWVGGMALLGAGTAFSQKMFWFVTVVQLGCFYLWALCEEEWIW